MRIEVGGVPVPYFLSLTGTDLILEKSSLHSEGRYTWKPVWIPLFGGHAKLGGLSMPAVSNGRYARSPPLVNFRLK